LKYYNLIIVINLLLAGCQLKPKPAKDQPSKSVIETIKPKKLTEAQQHNLVELKSLDSTFVYDLRYATTNNFVHKKMYPCAKCFVRPEVAKALVNIQKALQKKGLRLKLYDCYRPGKVQKDLWQIKPDPRFVADPKKGSMHNRGVAVDVTIVDKNGKELDMGTPFDYFGKKAYHDYQKLPDTVLKNRLFLKNIMSKYHLEPITSEWWHYSYRLKDFPIEQWVWKCP
jgi:D-alanyl-D-alanine dipeptidase